MNNNTIPVMTIFYDFVILLIDDCSDSGQGCLTMCCSCDLRLLLFRYSSDVNILPIQISFNKAKTGTYMKQLSLCHFS